MPFSFMMSLQSVVNTSLAIALNNFMLPIDTTPFAKVLLTSNYLNLIISELESRVEVL